MNLDAELLKKIIANQILQYIRVYYYISMSAY